jgi:hypothetical protein
VSKPDIYMGPRANRAMTKVHDHTRDVAFHYGMVRCEDQNCRDELIRMGGIEAVKRTWYVSRDISQVVIPQTDGTTHIHEPASGGLKSMRKHKPGVCQDEECEHTVTCDSPTCTKFFADEWERSVLGSGLPRPVAAPSEKDRPKTVTQIEEESRVFEEKARAEAQVELELSRLRRQELFPTLFRRR